MGADATVYEQLDPAMTTKFVGYDELTCEGEITAMTTETEVVSALNKGDKGTIVADPDSILCYKWWSGSVKE